MKRRLREETVIFISIMKWLVLASIIGLVVGLSTTLFLKLLQFSTSSARPTYYFILLPFGMLASAALIKYFAPDAEGYGARVIEAVHRSSGKIPVLVAPIKLIATLITVATGGSVGKEGPCAQIGAGLSSMLASMARFSESDRKKLVICGISGGFAAVFGTPIAGAIFGIEVLFVGGIMYEVLLPSFVAGLISYQVSSALGITYFDYALKFVPVFSEAFFIKVVFAGIFFGLVAFLTIEVLRFGMKLSNTMTKKYGIGELLKAFIAGVFLLVLVVLFSSRYLGLGLDTITATLGGEKVPAAAFFIKMLFTSITLNFGGSGGIITPIIFIGSAAGSLFAGLFGLNVAIFAAIGAVSVLAGAANTPIAASILAVELFGPEVAPYAAIACVISFIMTGHRSVYPSQILSMKKSASINVSLGQEMQSIRPTVEYREKSVLSTARNIVSLLSKKSPGDTSKSSDPTVEAEPNPAEKTDADKDKSP
ncbi:MAG: chloride channel protein [Proteobacteria bacterium]|nr:chloride channel protein [Pseudomonadota bacterium]